MSAEHVFDPTKDEAPVYFQYEEIDQQQETYMIGMWAFLVTEVMFFGALFLMYGLFRWKYQDDFYLAHLSLDWKLGGINTAILLISSFSMALAVRAAQMRKTARQLRYLGLTVLCAIGFMIVKLGMEWPVKFEHGLIPDNQFVHHYIHYIESQPAGPDAHGGAMPDVAKIFYSLYFTMTGLHGLHVLIGIILIGALMFLVAKKDKVITDYVPTEMIGLYWHFVDLVWIFLYPLFYLLPPR